MPIQIVQKSFDLNQTIGLDAPIGQVETYGIRVLCDADFQVHVFALNEAHAPHMAQALVGQTSAASGFLDYTLFAVPPGPPTVSVEVSLGCRAAHADEEVIVRARIPDVSPTDATVRVRLMVITEPGAHVTWEGPPTPLPHRVPPLPPVGPPK